MVMSMAQSLKDLICHSLSWMQELSESSRHLMKLTLKYFGIKQIIVIFVIQNKSQRHYGLRKSRLARQSEICSTY